MWASSKLSLLLHSLPLLRQKSRSLRQEFFASCTLTEKLFVAVDGILVICNCASCGKRFHHFLCKGYGHFFYENTIHPSVANFKTLLRNFKQVPYSHIYFARSKFRDSNFSNISSWDKSGFRPYAAKTASSSFLCARSSQVGRWLSYFPFCEIIESTISP